MCAASELSSDDSRLRTSEFTGPKSFLMLKKRLMIRSHRYTEVDHRRLLSAGVLVIVFRIQDPIIALVKFTG